MEQNLRLRKCETDKQVDGNQYRILIGRLLYLQATRPDITYTVNILSQFVGDPRQSHMDAADLFLRFLDVLSREDQEQVIYYSWEELLSHGNQRSNRSCPDPPPKLSIKQWRTAPTGPTPLFCDNQAARHIANNPVFHERTKHVEMDCYFVRERVDSKEIRTMAINTKGQIADILTKPLGANEFHSLLDKFGILNLHAPT
ncbi:secreted RxLR effector protein 161-like protein [Tanacetum coccineum]